MLLLSDSSLPGLSARLIAEMLNFQVELSFDRNLLLLHPKFFVPENCYDLNDLTDQRLNVSLAKSVGAQYVDFSLIYHADKMLWENIAGVFPSRSLNYRAELLTATIMHLKGIPIHLQKNDICHQD